MLRVTKLNEELLLNPVSRESIFSKSLIQGVGLALLFHLLFFSLFNIVSPSPDERVVSLLPSHVEIDLGQKSPLATVEHHSLHFKEVPSINHLGEGAIVSVDDYRPFSLKEPDFSEIEMFHYIPLEIDFDRD